jgi:hypothetical protein
VNVKTKFFNALLTEVAGKLCDLYGRNLCDYPVDVLFSMLYQIAIPKFTDCRDARTKDTRDMMIFWRRENTLDEYLLVGVVHQKHFPWGRCGGALSCRANFAN